MSRICSLLLPPRLSSSAPGRLLVARPLSRLSRGLSPLFILPVDAVEIKRPVVGSPVAPVIATPFASVLLLYRRSSLRNPTLFLLGSPGAQRCLVKTNIRSSPNVGWSMKWAGIH